MRDTKEDLEDKILKKNNQKGEQNRKKWKSIEQRILKNGRSTTE